MKAEYRATRAGEVAFQKAIRKLNEASEALSGLFIHSPLRGDDDSRAKLKRDLDEHAGFLEAARWWRVKK